MNEKSLLADDSNQDQVDNFQSHNGYNRQNGEHEGGGEQDPDSAKLGQAGTWTFAHDTERIRTGPGELEAAKYYSGLPSAPTLVARTGLKWNLDAGAKNLHPLDYDSLCVAWKNNLESEVRKLLNEKQVRCTSIDVVRIGNQDPQVVLWIGVEPASLSGSDGFAVANECLQILREHEFADVEVEIYEPRITPLATNDISTPPSTQEAIQYYYGLPSAPVLVARTGAPWEAPTLPEAYSRVRELRPVGCHALQDVWEDNLALKIIAALDASKVQWTGLDVVRIGYCDDDESVAPVVLWIGVRPASLSGSDGLLVARRCHNILKEQGITDVEVEIRESIVSSLDARPPPKLLAPVLFSDPTFDVRVPLTTTVGHPISAVSRPDVCGTGGFFLYEGKNSERRLLLVTARHVVFKPEVTESYSDKDNNQPLCVRLFSEENFQDYLKRIKKKIDDNESDFSHHRLRLDMAAQMTGQAWDWERKSAKDDMDHAEEAIKSLKDFYAEVEAQWSAPASRVLGHVVLAPSLKYGVGGKGYTEDWAVIEVDASKVDASNFRNFIDLSADISPVAFTDAMCPNPAHASSFRYPTDRLLRLQGVISDADMRNPPAASLDEHGGACLAVLKRGSGTGVTVGRANGVFSYANRDVGTVERPVYVPSKEWAILPRHPQSGFAARGDSGSVVVDGQGRVGGLLTGGAGHNRDDPEGSVDIAYVTPISFLLERMTEAGLVDPVVA